MKMKKKKHMPEVKRITVPELHELMHQYGDDFRSVKAEAARRRVSKPTVLSDIRRGKYLAFVLEDGLSLVKEKKAEN
jgi:hypothetical protein